MISSEEQIKFITNIYALLNKIVANTDELVKIARENQADKREGQQKLEELTKLMN